MTKRLEILKRSLEKKEQALNDKVSAIFSHQATTHGSPVNDKRGASSFFKKAERLNDSAGNALKEIEKTKEAIDREEWKIKNTESAKENFPQPILELIKQGVLVQWRKHPRFLFIEGVSKARLSWDAKKGLLIRYGDQVIGEERELLKSIFYPLKEALAPFIES